MVQPRVQPIGRQQLAVRAALRDPSAVKHQDPVRAQDRGEPVGNRDGGPALGEPGQGRLDEPLRHRVQRGCRLVKDQDLGVLEQHARNGQALLLAAGELVASLANHGVQPQGQFADAVQDGCSTARSLHLGHRRVGLCVQQVFADGRVEEVGLLGDKPDHAPQRLQRKRPHVVPVHGHLASGDVIQPRDQVGGGGLASARRSNQGHKLPRPCLKRDVFKPEGRDWLCWLQGLTRS